MAHFFHGTKARQGRVFPQHQSSPEERAKRRAEEEAFYQRCRVIFEQLRPSLISDYYNWFIFIEPDSRDYLLDPNRDNVLLQGLQKYSDKRSFIFRLNETGVCGMI